jgi:hypothetical protein
LNSRREKRKKKENGLKGSYCGSGDGSRRRSKKNKWKVEAQRGI